MYDCGVTQTILLSPLYAPAVKLLGQAGLHSAQKNEYLRG